MLWFGSFGQCVPTCGGAVLKGIEPTYPKGIDR